MRIYERTSYLPEVGRGTNGFIIHGVMCTFVLWDVDRDAYSIYCGYDATLEQVVGYNFYRCHGGLECENAVTAMSDLITRKSLPMQSYHYLFSAQSTLHIYITVRISPAL